MDWVLTASSSSNIHHVTDIKVGYNVPNTDILEYYTAYGPEMCKALARLGWSTERAGQHLPTPPLGATASNQRDYSIQDWRPFHTL